MSGVCQTGRQPILVAAKRDYLAAAVVLYGAVYDADWKSHPMRPESIETLLQKMKCPLTAVFGELDNLIHRDNIVRMTAVLAAAKKSFGIRVYPDAPHGFLERHHAGPLSPAPERRGMESDHLVFEIGVRRRMEKGPGDLAL